MKVETKQPEYTTEKANSLGAFTIIGKFHTNYPHAAYRNTNLGRAAELVNGTVLMPGEIFSLNDALGERTTANGFVDGYVINGGRLVKESGGGISQAALLSTAHRSSRRMRGTFSSRPPPVMCAMPLTAICFISASKGLT